MSKVDKRDSVSQDEIFEINDFTVVSEWERLVLRLETVLHEWHLGADQEFADDTQTQCPQLPKTAEELSTWSWHEVNVPLQVSALNMTMTHWKLTVSHSNTANETSVYTPESSKPAKSSPHSHLTHELLNTQNHLLDFYTSSLSPGHAETSLLPAYLCRWFGCTEMICIRPITATDVLYRETQWLMLLSACNLAVLNTQCTVPIFIQQHDRRRQMFTGVWKSQNSEAELRSVHLRRAPPNLMYLAGILEMFKSHVASPICSLDQPPVRVSVRLSFNLSDDQNDLHSDTAINQIDSDHPDQLTNILAAQTDQLNSAQLPKLAVGVCQHPISALRLLCTWPNVSEQLLVEHAHYSDLQPASAPFWALTPVFVHGLQCLMFQQVDTFLRGVSCAQTLNEVLGVSQDTDHSQSLNRLTQHNLPLAGITANKRNTTTINHGTSRSLLSEEQLADWLNVIFKSTVESDDVIIDSPIRHPKHNNIEITIDKLKEMGAMTEDMLEKHLNLVDEFTSKLSENQANNKMDNSNTDLGLISAGSLMHSQALQSDMQAFKAANPGACLSDFVRWHSPRDWINGALSARMNDESNIWHQSWQQAKACPAHRQTRLFNESKEAEHILSWLSSRSVGELLSLLLPALCSTALNQLIDEAGDVLNLIGDKLESAILKLISITRTEQTNTNELIDSYREVLSLIHWVETSLGQNRALYSRLHSLTQTNIQDKDLALFVQLLMKSDEAVPIFGAGNSELGRALLGKYFPKTSGSEPTLKANRKQYVLRWLINRPGSGSRPQPQRMFVCVDEQECRIHSLVTNDATFI